MKKKILIIVLAVIIAISIGILFWSNMFRNADEPLNSENASNNNIASAQNLAEEFTLEDLSGNEISLSDFRGRKVFLNFWATWCRACNLAMPYVNEIYRENHDIEIITINLREETGTIANYMERNNYEFRVLLDSNGRVGGLYRVNAVPFSVLIDEEGNIVNTRLGAMDREQLIEFMGL